MRLLSPPAVARADTEATPADCLPGPVLPLGCASHFPLINLQAEPLLTTDRAKLRHDHALLVVRALPARPVLVLQMAVHLYPPSVVIHPLQYAQQLCHAAIDDIGKLIRAANDRAPSEVWRKHGRKIRTRVSDSATAFQGHAKLPAGRCSGAPSPGLSCLRLPDPASTDCLRNMTQAQRSSSRRNPSLYLVGLHIMPTVWVAVDQPIFKCRDTDQQQSLSDCCYVSWA